MSTPASPHPPHDPPSPSDAGSQTPYPLPHGQVPSQPAARERHDDFNDPATSNLPELRGSDVRTPPPWRRRRILPLVLFFATCLSTFYVGAADWRPQENVTYAQMGRAMVSNWEQGLTYMGAVLAILLTHEMGHFLQTLRYHIPASYPLCIPVPFSLIGTMGAVISMDGMRANRKQIFDIGIAGPLAGLAVAIPVLYLGVRELNLNIEPQAGDIQLYNPIIVRWMIQWLHPEWADRSQWVAVSQLNAYFMAGWVGMLITGLNMLPISQLDGGHAIYALFGRDAHKLARTFVVVAIAYVVINLDQAAIWTPMLVLVILMGIHHPPTSDDSVELDTTRWTIGVLSLAIPVLCFPLLGLRQ